MPLEALADLGHGLRSVDQAYPVGLGPAARNVGVAHAVEECAVSALEPVEGFAGEALLRNLVAAVEHQGAIRTKTGVHCLLELLDDFAGNPVPRALIGVGRVREAVADDPRARRERGA